MVSARLVISCLEANLLPVFSCCEFISVRNLMGSRHFTHTQQYPNDASLLSYLYIFSLSHVTRLTVLLLFL